MSKIKEKIEFCESCGHPFPAGTLTTDHICKDCEEYWWDWCISKAQQWAIDQSQNYGVHIINA